MKEKLAKLFGNELFLEVSNNVLVLTEQENNNAEPCQLTFRNIDFLVRFNHDKIGNYGQSLFSNSQVTIGTSQKPLLRKKGDGILLCYKNDIINLYIIEYKLTIGSKTYNEKIHPQWISSCLSTLLILGLVTQIDEIQINWLMVGNICERDRQFVETWREDGRIYGKLLRNKKTNTRFSTELNSYNLQLSEMYNKFIINVFHIEPNSEIDLSNIKND